MHIWRVYLKKLKPPFEWRGFDITQDYIDFDSEEEMTKFKNGELAYDYLDNSQKLNPEEWEIIKTEYIHEK